MKKVLFYTQTCYLDAASEYIKLISEYYQVHVIIELTQSRLKSNVLDVETDLKDYKPITPYSEIESDWGIEHLKNFFEKCISVNFVIYRNKTDIIETSIQLINHIKKIKPDYIHMDDISPRLAFVYPYLFKFRNSLILNVHDPKNHIGEFEWKRFVLRKLFFKVTPVYITFSNYSKNELVNFLPKSKTVIDLKLLPFSIFNSFISKNAEPPVPTAISFIGRVSPYKGIDLFLEAIQIVEKEYPEQTYIIAGKSVPGYEIDLNKGIKNHKNLKVFNRHLTPKEISDTIINSKLIVCPYIEATQSGVIMTAYSLSRPVLITNIGGLPEYVIDGETGFITENIDSKSLADKIISFLKSQSVQQLSDKINSSVEIKNYKNYNIEKIKLLYK